MVYQCNFDRPSLQTCVLNKIVITYFLVKSQSQLCKYSSILEPVIQLMKPQISVNESVGVAHLPLTRSGDLSQSMIVLCSTLSSSAQGSSGNRLQSGTDFLSLTDHSVKFEEGANNASCEVKVCLQIVFVYLNSTKKSGTSSTA